MTEEIKKELLHKAGALLARRAHSRGELHEKLLACAEDESVEWALNRLESLNLLNDAEFAYNFALGRMKRQGWSASKIIEALLRRQVDKDVAESAIARIQDEAPEKFSIAYHLKEYCRKKGEPANLNDVRKAILHLRRCGFEEEDIFQALRKSCPNSKW
jgi:SOS response regulatory protein OraA/RecX